MAIDLLSFLVSLHDYIFFNLVYYSNLKYILKFEIYNFNSLTILNVHYLITY